VVWNYFGWSVMKTNDRGENWSPVNSGSPLRDPNVDPCCVDLALDPHHPDTLYLGISEAANRVEGLYKTTDGATTWTRAPGPDGAWGRLVFDPQNPRTLYADVCVGLG